MKLQEVSHRRARGDRRDYLKFSFSAFSHRGVGTRPYGPEAANSAVNYYVSCSIRPAVFSALILSLGALWLSVKELLSD